MIYPGIQWITLSLFLWVVSSTLQAETSAILEQELAVDEQGRANKLETLLRPEWNYSLSNNWSATLIGELRYDAFAELGPSASKPINYGKINGPLVAGSEGSLHLRELFFDGEVRGSFWRIGKQQVVWGQADGLKVLDVVNPQSFREFILDDFEDSRIPLWMLNIDIPTGENGSVQLLWVPDNSYHEFAEDGTQFQITSELLLPAIATNQTVLAVSQTKPESIYSDSDVGIRFSNFVNGWDYTLNYFYHFHDSPVVFQTERQHGIDIDSTYRRNHLIGASASNTFGDFTFRAEVGFNSDTYHYTLPTDLGNNQGVHNSQEISSVVGLDWQGLDNTLLSVQWFQSRLLDYPSNKDIIRDQQNNIASFLYQQTFNNEIITVDLLALHSFNDKEGSVQLTLSYQWQSDITLWLGSDIFYGDQNGLFGQFSNNDRLTIGWQWGF